MNNYVYINGRKTELTQEMLDAIKKIQLDARADGIKELSAIVRSGKARSHHKVNDIVTLTGTEYVIIGFDCERLKSASSRHTITLMKNTLLPPRRMNGGECEHGWADTELRKYLNDDYYKTLPTELREHICPVMKTTHNYNGTRYETADNLFAPSESELFGSAIWSDYEDGARYEAFATSELRARKDDDGDYHWYWTRSASGGSSTSFAIVHSSGIANSISASSSAIRVPLCLCFS